MVGDNSLVKTLRILKSNELFLNAGYYCNPPCFFSLIKEHGKHFQKGINNLLPSSVSVECLDTWIAKNDLVGLEAIQILLIRSGLYFCVFLVFLLFA